ncbi:MAG: hypothetical protein ACE5LS_02135 [Thermoplasmata archaeon]
MREYEGEGEGGLPARKRLGILVGVAGLLLLFGSAISLRFVPLAWQIVILGLIATGVGALVVAYLLVR